NPPEKPEDKGCLGHSGERRAPHFIRKQVNTLLPAKQAKQFTNDGAYSIAKYPKALPASPRDIILRCGTRQHKQTLIRTVHNQSPLDFQSHKISIFQDLHRSTLLWRKTMEPITQRLKEAGIPHKWTTPRAFIVTKDGMQFKATDVAEATTFLAAIVLGNGPREQKAHPTTSTRSGQDA
ncbi:Hypothetical predicted protein, partial [Pelobates cultripes]